MKIRKITLTLAVFAFVSSSACHANAPLAERVPQEAMFYLGWAGRSLAFDGSRMGQLINDPSVQAISSKVYDAVTNNIPGKNNKQLAPHLWRMASIAWQHPAAAAITKISPPAGPEGEPKISAMLIIDLGQERSEFQRHLNDVFEILARDNSKMLGQDSVGGVSFRTIDTPGGRVAVGCTEKIFFLSIGPDMPKTILATTASASLQKNQKFAAAFKAVDGENVQMAYYADVPAIISAADAAFAVDASDAGGPRVSRTAEALGLEKITAVVGAARIVERGMYTRERLFSAAPHEGLLKLLSGPPLSDADLAAAPQDADFVMAGKVLPDQAYTVIRRAVEKISPPADRQLADALTGVQKEFELSLREDILAHLAETWIISSAASHGGFATGTLVSVSATNPEALQASLSKLRKRAGEKFKGEVKFKTLTSAQTKIHYAGFPGPVPAAPAWAVHKGRLYIAAWPQVIATAIETADAEPVTRSRAYQSVRARLANKPSIVTYVNTPQIIRRLYNWMLLGWSAGAGALTGMTPLEADVTWLPPLSRLEKYFTPDIRGISADKDGITVESYGTLPNTNLGHMPNIAPMAAAIAVPAIGEARNKARQAASANNLRNIGAACQMYAMDYDQKFPPDLGVLVRKKYLDLKSVASPAGGNDSPKIAEGKIVTRPDYIYLGKNMTAISPARSVLAYERPENYNGRGTNVLFVDCHVEWVPMNKFMKMMETRGLEAEPETGNDS